MQARLSVNPSARTILVIYKKKKQLVPGFSSAHSIELWIHFEVY